MNVLYYALNPDMMIANFTLKEGWVKVVPTEIRMTGMEKVVSDAIWNRAIPGLNLVGGKTSTTTELASRDTVIRPELEIKLLVRSRPHPCR